MTSLKLTFTRRKNSEVSRDQCEQWWFCLWKVLNLKLNGIRGIINALSCKTPAELTKPTHCPGAPKSISINGHGLHEKSIRDTPKKARDLKH